MYPYGLQDKKSLNMRILEILEQYSDSDHRLTQPKIIKLLEQNYGIECKRQTVKNNIMLLKDMGYEISWKGGIFLKLRRFEDAELRMLIDSVLFFPHPFRRAGQTIDRETDRAWQQILPR